MLPKQKDGFPPPITILSALTLGGQQPVLPLRVPATSFASDDIATFVCEVHSHEPMPKEQSFSLCNYVSTFVGTALLSYETCHTFSAMAETEASLANETRPTTTTNNIGHFNKFMTYGKSHGHNVATHIRQTDACLDFAHVGLQGQSSGSLHQDIELLGDLVPGILDLVFWGGIAKATPLFAASSA